VLCHDTCQERANPAPSWHHMTNSTTPYFLYKISPVADDT
jgi:hypothetical protein